ncbi:MAG: PAS domain-containing sensor histidine kinase [Gammaproteobacteria bacterium]
MNAVSNLSNADLHTAFEQFNQISEQFTHAYQDLEGRFKQIKSELSDTKAKRLLELAEKEQLANRMHLLLMALPMGVMVIDSEGVIRECNQSSTELLNTQLHGKLWSDVIKQLFPEQSQTDISSIDINGRNIHFSSKSIDGSKDSLVLVNDVTDPVTHIDSVKRKERLAFLGNAIASIAHDIRTPLATSFLHLSNLNRKLKSQDHGDYVRVVDKVRHNLKTLENTINSMLIYAKGGADTFELMECKKCCELIATDLFELFPSVTFTIHAQEDLKNKHIKINFNALMTSFRNLIANSQAVSEKDVAIKINFISDKDSFLKITVADNGPGIDVETIDKIFEPFFTARKNGTGLGLSIVKSIIESHRGNITAENISTGAMFNIELPLEYQEWKSEIGVNQ